MYFYMYAGLLYWGRYQGIASDPSVVKAWYFRNKPMKPGRCYISGPYSFHYQISDFGLYKISVSYQGGAEQSYYLPVGSMFYWALSRNEPPRAIDRHEEARALTARTFRNRLKEYTGRYFLPFHRHSRCV